MGAMAEITVKLPDGTPLELPEGASGTDAAAAIGPGLAKAALAGRPMYTPTLLARAFFMLSGSPLAASPPRKPCTAWQLGRSASC